MGVCRELIEQHELPMPLTWQELPFTVSIVTGEKTLHCMGNPEKINAILEKRKEKRQKRDGPLMFFLSDLLEENSILRVKSTDKEENEIHVYSVTDNGVGLRESESEEPMFVGQVVSALTWHSDTYTAEKVFKRVVATRKQPCKSISVLLFFIS